MLQRGSQGGEQGIQEHGCGEVDFDAQRAGGYACDSVARDQNPGDVEAYVCRTKYIITWLWNHISNKYLQAEAKTNLCRCTWSSLTRTTILLVCWSSNECSCRRPIKLYMKQLLEGTAYMHYVRSWWILFILEHLTNTCFSEQHPLPRHDNCRSTYL